LLQSARTVSTKEFEIERTPLERFEGGERCAVRARVPPDLRYLEGHFPDHPIVPGIAQLLPLVDAQARAVWPDLPVTRTIKRLKFLEAIKPGDVLTVSFVREPAKLRFEIHRSGVLCTLGTFGFA
jgi:3-hydroxymyristoyl/3-hydroxydecanoyl-(acyl carrier protein) dehydratase